MRIRGRDINPTWDGKNRFLLEPALDGRME